MTRKLLFFVAAVAVISCTASPAMAQFGQAQFGQGNSANNLFSQYYTQPGASQVQAGMYMAPHYVPANVGHAYYTYQPLMPHEMMYHHSRNYFNYYNTGGYIGGCDALTRTQVNWYSGANHMRPMPLQGLGAQRLIWAFQKHKYGLNCATDGLGCGGLGCGRRGCKGQSCGLSNGEAGCADCGANIGSDCNSGACAKLGDSDPIRR